MRVVEQFDSIQGEGVHAGIIMSFIRLQGCNLRCAWCDTKYAYEGGHEISVSDINPHRKWVCITGGEPLLQQDELAGLILKLKHRGKQIEIETNGSITPPDWAFVELLWVEDVLMMVNSWVIDIKLSSTGNPSSPATIQEWANDIRPSDQIKFVVMNHKDLDEAEYWMQSLPLTNTIISPVMPCSQAFLQEVAEFCISRDARFSMQLQKIIWGNRRGF